ncbi:MAG: tRNA (adenosine(37)-N6)-dimethylallyltransferase MiaA [Proteobacteria bacterium]|nr:tRNA (adenosine(37)-N6)-dimethylallyltransferase MiaA [Pseudomonadota bacterium]MBU1612126.1 tRNA (adenosine(37)-N6)-dimethylallyltransferase MiaA [Pseudomonadota bacterium]
MAPTRIVCILGPTGTGKTRAALGLGVPTAVINYDSRQVYRDFPIITAQPTPEERAVCPHLLYGFAPPTERMNAAAFADLALGAIAEAAAMNRLPVLVGGTGLYLKALLEGMSPIAEIKKKIREEVLSRLASEGPQKMHRELRKIDPDYAAVIHENDSQRNARAMEVWLSTGRTMTQWHAEAHPRADLDVLKVGIHEDLETLTPGLAKRIDLMVTEGAVEEARAAWERCPDPTAPAWTGIGCAELLAHVRGEIDLFTAKRLWVKNTRAYAKRQITWGKKEKDTQWFKKGDVAGLVEAVRQWLGA